MSLDNEREKLVYMAKLAEQAERYDDMVNHMEKVAKLNVELSLQERQLLSSAYKNVIGARRGASRIFSINELMEESDGNENNVKIIKVYHQEVQEELTKLCNDVLALIDDHLIPYASSVESKIFYYKMKGDYYRYVAEYKTGQERKEVAELSREAYRVASDIASDNLPYAHALRLGVALNLSVFYYEIEESPEKAWEFARQTIENAFLDLDSLSEESYRESTLIMQLLRENMTFWKLDSPDEEEDVERDAPAESEGR